MAAEYKSPWGDDDEMTSIVSRALAAAKPLPKASHTAPAKQTDDDDDAANSEVEDSEEVAHPHPDAALV